MPTLKNPYTGISPHLNSLLQTPGTDEQPSLWRSFHAAYIVIRSNSPVFQMPQHNHLPSQ